MTSNIRIRPTALILNEGKVLLIQYKEHDQIHYNLPGGGSEPGETLAETLRRELLEEANSTIHIGPVALMYEYSPHKQSGDYESNTPSIYVVFDCSLPEDSIPSMPDTPDPNQVGVKWLPLEELENVILYPRIQQHIIEYSIHKRSIEWIEDHQLKSYKTI